MGRYFEFIKLYEMGTMVTVFKVIAKDITDAKRYAIIADTDYDLISQDGELVE